MILFSVTLPSFLIQSSESWYQTTAFRFQPLPIRTRAVFI